MNQTARPILVVLATKPETDAVLEAVRPGEFDAPVVVRMVGVGKVRSAVATAAEIAAHRPRVVVMGGTAGSAHPDVRVGDAVVAESVFEHDWYLPPAFAKSSWLPRAIYLDAALARAAQDALRQAGVPSHGAVHHGAIATGDQVVNAPLLARRRHAGLIEAHAYDMESAAVAYAVSQATLYGEAPRLLVVRTVSDHAFAGKQLAFRRACALAAEVMRTVLHACIQDGCR